MGELVYNSLSSYFHALGVKGYMPYSEAQKLLILSFYKDFVFSDFRGLLSKDDYHMIEMALDCLYGSTCLIPYPDYLKMGKLYLGEITEMAQRVKTLENTNVLKAMDDPGSADSTESDIYIEVSED